MTKLSTIDLLKKAATLWITLWIIVFADQIRCKYTTYLLPNTSKYGARKLLKTLGFVVFFKKYKKNGGRIAVFPPLGGIQTAIHEQYGQPVFVNK